VLERNRRDGASGLSKEDHFLMRTRIVRVWAERGFAVTISVILASCALLGGAPSASSKPDQEPPPHIRHYLERTAAFEKENQQMRNVILLGDSLTEGFNVEQYFPGRPVINRGISSDTIGIVPDDKDLRGVLKRLDNSVFDCCPGTVFLMIGVNDLGDRRQPEEMAAGFREILERIRERAPGVTVYVESALPTGGKYAFHNPNILDYNARLRALADEMGYPYLDLHPLFTDENGELRSDLTREGLHLTPAGYEIWKREIVRAMGWDE
jgi:lysophospholipase L1-like esterase